MSKRFTKNEADEIKLNTIPIFGYGLIFLILNLLTEKYV